MIDLSKLKNTSWHNTPIDETTFILDTNLAIGLSSQEAEARLEQVGQNSLTEEKKEPFWK